MGRELRGLQQRGEGEQRGGGGRGPRRLAGPRGGVDGGDVHGAEAEAEHQRGGHQRDVARAGEDRVLARRPPRLRPLRVEEQQALQAEAGEAPGRRQQHEVARLHQQERRDQRQQQPAGEGPLPRLAIEVGGGVAHDHPSDEGDQHQHGGGDGIKPHERQRRAARPTEQQQEQDGERRQRQRGQRRDPCQAQRRGGAEPWAAEGQHGGEQERQGREQGWQGGEHGRVPRGSVRVHAGTSR